jgi:hypothetical protein
VQNVIWLKSILCVWASLQLVLPGCLCQLLEPLGIHVAHHHHPHGTVVQQGHRDPCELKAPLPQGTGTEIPCHCDERPDRNTDESLASADPDTPELQNSKWAMLPKWDHCPAPPVAQLVRLAGRGPPHDGMDTAEEARLARCVHLL